jgi:hypothetical protein
MGAAMTCAARQADVRTDTTEAVGAFREKLERAYKKKGRGGGRTDQQERPKILKYVGKSFFKKKTEWGLS